MLESKKFWFAAREVLGGVFIAFMLFMLSAFATLWVMISAKGWLLPKVEAGVVNQVYVIVPLMIVFFSIAIWVMYKSFPAQVAPVFEAVKLVFWYYPRFILAARRMPPYQRDRNLARHMLTVDFMVKRFLAQLERQGQTGKAEANRLLFAVDDLYWAYTHSWFQVRLSTVQLGRNSTISLRLISGNFGDELDAAIELRWRDYGNQPHKLILKL